MKLFPASLPCGIPPISNGRHPGAARRHSRSGDIGAGLGHRRSFSGSASLRAWILSAAALHAVEGEGVNWSVALKSMEVDGVGNREGDAVGMEGLAGRRRIHPSAVSLTAPDRYRRPQAVMDKGRPAPSARIFRSSSSMRRPLAAGGAEPPHFPRFTARSMSVGIFERPTA